MSAIPREEAVGRVSAFAVEIDGEIAASFQECSGLSIEVEVMELVEGGRMGAKTKFPGQASYSNLKLKRGVTASSDLYDWFRKVLESRGDVRKDMSVLLLDEKGGTICSWHFHGAFPVKWTGPTLSTTGQGVAVEEIEFAHEGAIFL